MLTGHNNDEKCLFFLTFLNCKVKLLHIQNEQLVKEVAAAKLELEQVKEIKPAAQLYSYPTGSCRLAGEDQEAGGQIEGARGYPSEDGASGGGEVEAAGKSGQGSGGAQAGGRSPHQDG